MQQILRDLQEHGFEKQQRRERWKDRRKAEEKRAGNPCELKKAHSLNKAKTELHKRISTFNQSTAVKRSAYTFSFIAL